MFNITESPEFTHTVHVQVPVDGGHEEQTFKARFRVVEEKDTSEADFYKPTKIREALRARIVSMDDLVDGKGNAVTYNDKVRDQLLEMQHVRIALLRTYRDAMSKERAGN